MRLRRAWLAGVALSCLACTAARGPDPRTATFPPVRFDPPALEQAALSGGVKVFLLEDRTVPLVRIYLAFRGGSLYDPPEKAGLADVTALAWRTGGAGERSPEAFDEELEGRAIELSLGLGREAGWVTLSVLPADVDQGLALLCDLLFRPEFREERVRWAVGQVSERLRREVDDPSSLAFREMRRALYRGHPRGLVPTPETAGRVTRADVVSLWERVVREGEWVAGVAGDFDRAELLGALEARLGALPAAGRGFEEIEPPRPPAPVTILVPRPIPQTTVLWARLGPGRTDADFAPLEVADHVLGSGGFQSRLVREVRSNRGLAYGVGSFYQALPRFGVLGVTAATRSDTALEVLGLLRSIPEEAGRAGLGAEEVERAKEALVNRHVFRYEDPASTVRERLSLELDGLPPDLPGRYVSEIGAVGVPEASGAAARHFGGAPTVTVVVGAVAVEDPAWERYGRVEVVSVPAASGAGD